MTSWKRGKENERKGDRMMDEPGMGDKVKGAALKAAGMAEQGVDNVKDRVMGDQKDLQGKERTGASTSHSHEHEHSRTGTSHGHEHEHESGSQGSRSHEHEHDTEHKRESGSHAGHTHEKSSESHRSAKSK